MEILGGIGAALGISLGMGAVLLFILLVVSMFTIRNQVQNKIWLYHIEPNNNISGHLYRMDSNTVDIVEREGVTRKKKRRMSYFINPEKQFGIMYPPGWPTIVQEPVKAQIHIRGKAEPVDPRGLATDTGDEVLKSIKNVTVLRNMAERAERMSQGALGRLGGITTILIVLAAAGSLAAAYFSFRMTENIDQIIHMLGG